MCTGQHKMYNVLITIWMDFLSVCVHELNTQYNYIENQTYQGLPDRWPMTVLLQSSSQQYRVHPLLPITVKNHK